MGKFNRYQLFFFLQKDTNTCRPLKSLGLLTFGMRLARPATGSSSLFLPPEMGLDGGRDQISA